MTDDLVKRLRSITDTKVLCKDCYKSFEAADEAADRIEALEAALRKICDGPRDADKSYPELLAEVRIEARAALAGEKKDE